MSTITFEPPTCAFCGKKAEPNETFCHGNGNIYICTECVDEFHESINAANTFIENARKIQETDNIQKSRLPTPSQLKAHLDEYIIGQDYAKRVISVAVYNHYKMLKIKGQEKAGKTEKTVDLEKSNVLLLGPSGSGKTAIVRAIAKKLKVPFTMTDATLYSAAGYVGMDVECMVRQLVEAANGNIEAAERGIIFIDEIDKTSRKGENLSTTADPGHEGVQQSLLKLLEGNVVNVPEKGRRAHPEADTITVNTENILFIVGGAFEGIEKITAKRLRSENQAGTMGFGSQLVDKKNQQYNEYIEKVSTDDLKKFGMLPELLGRVPVIAPMKELTEDQLVEILHKPKNALTKQYQRLMAQDGVDLQFTDAALRVIARRAVEKKTGARGLRGIMEDILNPVMFETPDRNEDTIIIDANDDDVSITYQTKRRKEAV